jgi:surface antigen
LVVCLLAVAAWPSVARAQINPFVGYKGPTLSKEDLAAGRAAAGKLLSDDHAEVGKSEDWSGASSGNQGSVTVLRAFKQRGLDCRALRSEVRYKASPAKPRTFSLNVCELKDGTWKIL